MKIGPVMASGVVGLIAGLTLPPLFPQIGGMLAVMAFCASFAGMSSREQMTSELPIALTGFLTALAYLYCLPWEGAGGKLGTIAFGTALAVKGWMDFLKKMKKPVKLS